MKTKLGQRNMIKIATGQSGISMKNIGGGGSQCIHGIQAGAQYQSVDNPQISIGAMQGGRRAPAMSARC